MMPQDFDAVRARMTEKMLAFYAGSIHDVDHFLKVTAYADLIASLSGVSEDIRQTVILTAIVHDIACPLCREKYGSAPGNRQEEESEALLRPFLAEFALPDALRERIIFIVCHHHTYTGVDGMDWQIMLEADFLVNAAESSMSAQAVRNFDEKVFRTEAGHRLLRELYPTVWET